MPQYGVTDQPTVARSTLGAASHEQADGQYTALLVGRLLAFKGGALALRAVALSPRWRLVICGTGPDEARLRRLAGKLKLRDRVEFTGWLDRGAVLSLMVSANALLFPSLHDESPATVLEARLCGLPVICLDHGGAAVLAGPTALAVAATGGPRAVIPRLAAALEAIERRPSSPPSGTAELSLEARAAELEPALKRVWAGGSSRTMANG
jgi:glycosyltransferase involved in cell wall biosynthesis